MVWQGCSFEAIEACQHLPLWKSSISLTVNGIFRISTLLPGYDLSHSEEAAIRLEKNRWCLGTFFAVNKMAGAETPAIHLKVIKIRTISLI